MMYDNTTCRYRRGSLSRRSPARRSLTKSNKTSWKRDKEKNDKPRAAHTFSFRIWKSSWRPMDVQISITDSRSSICIWLGHPLTRRKKAVTDICHVRCPFQICHIRNSGSSNHRKNRQHLYNLGKHISNSLVLVRPCPLPAQSTYFENPRQKTNQWSPAEACYT